MIRPRYVYTVYVCFTGTSECNTLFNQYYRLKHMYMYSYARNIPLFQPLFSNLVSQIILCIVSAKCVYNSYNFKMLLYFWKYINSFVTSYIIVYNYLFIIHTNYHIFQTATFFNFCLS